MHHTPQTPTTAKNPALRKLLTASAVVMGVLLTGCAALQPASPEEAVTKRADQRWKALMAADWAKAYSFLTPAFRSTMSVERYRERFVGVPRWTNVTVKSAKCEPEKCTVVVRIEAEYGARSGIQTLSTDVPETWLQEDGTWYKYEAM